MSKLTDKLNKQLKTEHKKDAEDCLKIAEKLKEIDDNRIWSNKWSILVDTIYKGFPHDERRYKPTTIGRIFLKGIENE